MTGSTPVNRQDSNLIYLPLCRIRGTPSRSGQTVQRHGVPSSPLLYFVSVIPESGT